MRKIRIIEPNTTEWKKWKQKCDILTKKLIKIWKPGQELKIDDKLYKEQKDFYRKKTSPFYGRCAYCESQYRYHDDLDHYRPKKGVTNENDEPILVEIDGDTINHPGYYWLSYSWNNLLPVCKDCNSKTVRNEYTIGKQNRFPLEGDYAVYPGEEEIEKPLLLNPIIDTPEEHFNWDSKLGLIIAKQGDKKGQLTIRILGFHVREQLIENWRKTYEETQRKYWSLMNPDTDNEQRGIKLEDFKDKIEKGEYDFSFVAKAAMEEFVQ